MKYLITVILALGFAGYAFIKGYSVRDHEDDGIEHACAPDSILSAKNPDARYSHCRDEDWDGSTILRDRLAEAQARPDLYGILLESNELRRLASPFPPVMTPDEDAEQPPASKPSPIHRGSL